jgi:AP2-like factor (ANT lineage)
MGHPGSIIRTSDLPLELTPHMFMRNLAQGYNIYTFLAITGTGVDKTQEKDAAAGATDLSMFTAGPKLEDFLGGSAATAGAAPLAQFSNETQMTLTMSEPEMYDSELKTIAASFLRGFSTEKQTQAQKQPLAAADPPPKKPVDTFGQRTSIYRGVTR